MIRMLYRGIISTTLVMLLFLLPQPVMAEEMKVPATTRHDSSFDWLQLTTGEWLKGRVKFMYHDVVEFDSEHLEILDVDMEDIELLDVQQPMSVNVEHVGTVTGIISIRGANVYIHHDGKQDRFDRSAIISFTPAGTSEFRLWSIKIGLSMDFRRGNTNQSDVTAMIKTQRRSAVSRYTLNYIGNLSSSHTASTNPVVTEHNQRFTAEADFFASRHLFYRLISGEFYRDPIQNVSRRLSVYSGIGYMLNDSRRTDGHILGGAGGVRYRLCCVGGGWCV